MAFHSKASGVSYQFISKRYLSVRFSEFSSSVLVFQIIHTMPFRCSDWDESICTKSFYQSLPRFPWLLLNECHVTTPSKLQNQALQLSRILSAIYPFSLIP